MDILFNLPSIAGGLCDDGGHVYDYGSHALSKKNCLGIIEIDSDGDVLICVKYERREISLVTVIVNGIDGVNESGRNDECVSFCIVV